VKRILCCLATFVSCLDIDDGPTLRAIGPQLLPWTFSPSSRGILNSTAILVVFPDHEDLITCTPRHHQSLSLEGLASEGLRQKHWAEARHG